MQMADAEVLLDDISDFRDGLVALDLELGQLGGGGVLAHDAILDLIERQKVPVGFTGVSLVGVDFLYWLFGMTTVDRAVGQKVGIVDRSGCKGGGQHKAVFGIHRDVLLEAKVRGVVSNGPVGFQISGELQRLSGFILFSFFGLAVFTLLFQFILTQGSTGGLDQAGIHGNALIDAKPLLLELAQDFGIDRIHGGFGQPASEAGEGRVIRGRLAEGQVQEGFEGEPVIDLVFQLGVRLNTEPLLQQQAFEEHERRVGASALIAGAHGVMTEQNGFDTRPVDGAAELFHEFNAAVLLQAVGQGEVCEIQAAGGLFESHANLLI